MSALRLPLAALLIFTVACAQELSSPPVATHIAFINQPASVLVGEPLGPVAVAFLNVDDVVVASDGGTVTIKLAGGDTSARLVGQVSTMSVLGVANFGGLTVSKPGTGFRLVAKSAGFDSTVSQPFNITP